MDGLRRSGEVGEWRVLLSRLPLRGLLGSQRNMKICKRLLILFLGSLGLTSVKAQPATPEPVEPSPDGAGRSRLEPAATRVNSSSPDVNVTVGAAPDPAQYLLAPEQEEQARKLLGTPSEIKVAAQPQTIDPTREILRQQQLKESQRQLREENRMPSSASGAQAVAQELEQRSQQDAQRRERIARIEAELAARKQGLAPTAPAPERPMTSATVAAPVTPAVAASPTAGHASEVVPSAPVSAPASEVQGVPTTPQAPANESDLSQVQAVHARELLHQVMSAPEAAIPAPAPQPAAAAAPPAPMPAAPAASAPPAVASPGEQTPMTAEEAAKAQEILQQVLNESYSAPRAAGMVPLNSETGDHRTTDSFSKAVKGSFLGRRGRDMFDVRGGIEIAPPPPPNFAPVGEDVTPSGGLGMAPTKAAPMTPTQQKEALQTLEQELGTPATAPASAPKAPRPTPAPPPPPPPAPKAQLNASPQAATVSNSTEAMPKPTSAVAGQATLLTDGINESEAVPINAREVPKTDSASPAPKPQSAPAVAPAAPSVDSSANEVRAKKLIQQDLQDISKAAQPPRPTTPAPKLGETPAPATTQSALKPVALPGQLPPGMGTGDEQILTGKFLGWVEESEVEEPRMSTEQESAARSLLYQKLNDLDTLTQTPPATRTTPPPAKTVKAVAPPPPPPTVAPVVPAPARAEVTPTVATPPPQPALVAPASTPASSVPQMTAEPEAEAQIVPKTKLAETKSVPAPSPSATATIAAEAASEPTPAPPAVASSPSTEMTEEQSLAARELLRDTTYQMSRRSAAASPAGESTAARPTGPSTSPQAGNQGGGIQPPPGVNLSSEDEQKAREVLRKKLSEINGRRTTPAESSYVPEPLPVGGDAASASPVPVKPPAAVVPEVSQAAPIAEPPPVAALPAPSAAAEVPAKPTARNMSVEQEAKARSLLDNSLTELAPPPAPAAPAALPPAPKSAPPVPPPPAPASAAVAPESAPIPVPAPAAVAPTSAATAPTGMTPEMEQRAKALLASKLNESDVTPAPAMPTATLEGQPRSWEKGRAELEQIKKAEEAAIAKEKAAAKRVAKADEAARKRIEAMEAEAMEQARNEARKRLEAEAQALVKADRTAPAAVPVDSSAQPARPSPTQPSPVAPETAPQPAPAKVTPPSTPEPAPANVAAVTGTKQERLDALLDAYASDKVTAQQYHVERQKILSEP